MNLYKADSSITHLEGHSPLHWWSPVWGAFAKRKNKGMLTEPLVCTRHCMECFTCIMESKLPPTVTYPLFYAPPEKQNHYQSIKGWHPGCIHCEAKETTSLKALHFHRSSQGSQRAPAMCSHAHIFVKFAKRYSSCNQTTVSLHSDFQSLTHYALC